MKGSNLGIGEQFPEEIVKIRKQLYPELKRAKDAGKKAKLVCDKLIIEGEIFHKLTLYITIYRSYFTTLGLCILTYILSLVFYSISRHDLHRE